MLRRIVLYFVVLCYKLVCMLLFIWVGVKIDVKDIFSNFFCYYVVDDGYC